MVVRMSRRRSMTIRPIMPGDFSFIRSLASNVEGYTVPSPYVLWMLGRFHSGFCAVAVDAGQNRLGYLLAMPTSDPGDGVFVWQLALTFRGRRLKAQDHLAMYLKKTMRASKVHHLFFTTAPLSPTERSVTAIAKRVFHASPAKGRRLPGSVPGGESEYDLVVKITKVGKPR